MNTFIETVQKMRRAQNDFFKSKDYKLLQESKRLENEVDRMLQEFDEGKNPEIWEKQ